MVRQENGIQVAKLTMTACIDWNFAILNGRGVYKGDKIDVLKNHKGTIAWYEKDEKDMVTMIEPL